MVMLLCASKFTTVKITLLLKIECIASKWASENVGGTIYFAVDGNFLVTNHDRNFSGEFIWKITEQKPSE